MQVSIDSEHKLIADFKVTTKPNDQRELAPIAIRVKRVLDSPAITVLTDKGCYHTRELVYCNGKGNTTYVPKKVCANSTGCERFFPDKFTYRKGDDYYYCPAGNILPL